MALLDVELPHRVGDVDDLDLRGGYASCGKCAGSGLLDEVADLQRLLGEVAGEIALVAADDPDILLHRHVRSSRMRSGSVHAKPEMRSGSVAARTSASVTPGAHSTSRRPSSVTSRTARVSMRTVGMPQIPKPPQAIAAPWGMSATASAAVTMTLSIVLLHLRSVSPAVTAPSPVPRRRGSRRTESRPRARSLRRTASSPAAPRFRSPRTRGSPPHRGCAGRAPTDSCR